MSPREKNQADFDLERVMDLFDDALTSKDERVVNALRQLLMIVALTAPESNDGIMDKKIGPFRQLQDDLSNMYRRLGNLEGELQQIRSQRQYPYGGAGSPNPWSPGPGSPYPNPTGPYTSPTTGAPGLWWGIDPNMPYTTSKSDSSTSISITNPGATSGSFSLTSSQARAIINGIDDKKDIE